MLTFHITRLPFLAPHVSRHRLVFHQTPLLNRRADKLYTSQGAGTVKLFQSKRKGKERHFHGSCFMKLQTCLISTVNYRNKGGWLGGGWGVGGPKPASKQPRLKHIRAAMSCFLLVYFHFHCSIQTPIFGFYSFFIPSDPVMNLLCGLVRVLISRKVKPIKAA